MMSSRVHSLATRANRQAEAMNRKNTERMMVLVNSAIINGLKKYRKPINNLFHHLWLKLWITMTALWSLVSLGPGR